MIWSPPSLSPPACFPASSLGLCSTASVSSTVLCSSALLCLCRYSSCCLGCKPLSVFQDPLAFPLFRQSPELQPPVQEQYLGTARPLTPPAAAHSSGSLGPPSSAASGWKDFSGISGRGTFFAVQSLGRVHLQTEAPCGSCGFESCGLSHRTCYILTIGTTR